MHYCGQTKPSLLPELCNKGSMNIINYLHKQTCNFWQYQSQHYNFIIYFKLNTYNVLPSSHKADSTHIKWLGNFR